MTIRALFDEAVQQVPDAPVQRYMRADAWVTRTYAALRERVLHAAGAVAALGITPGRDHVALMLDNRPEWQEIYLALAGAGVAVVPLDPRLRPGEVAHILADSGSIAIFAEAKLKGLLAQIAPELPRLRDLVLVNGAADHGATCEGRPCWDYEMLLTAAAGRLAAARDWFDRHLPAHDDIASIIYTSGTTGKPKGAMLTHGNFCADVAGTLKLTPFGPKDNFLIVLPLFHAYSFTANFLVPLANRASMSFVRGIKTVAEDMRILHPTVLLTVPLMAEKMFARVSQRLRASWAARVLLAVGLRGVVRRKVLASLGGRLNFIGVGGAACPVEVIEGFRRLGIPIAEGYGLTEAAPGVCYGNAWTTRPGSVGRPLPNIEVRIAGPDAQGVGELQVRGPIVMKGYFGNPAATAEAIDPDGWLSTGDLAALSREGEVTIRGRKKALIVNREGKNIYPEEVEQCIAQSPFVLDVIVLGYQAADAAGERVGVIVTPNGEAIAASRGGRPLPDAELDGYMRQVVQVRCASLSDYKRPRKIDVRREPLDRTSIMKVRRHVYAGTLDEN
jgi:long-chain acyl-CoA synthetase